MKKFIAILLMIVMLVPSALAADITSQIDYSALKVYVDSWNARMNELDISLSFGVSYDTDYISFNGSFLSPKPRQVSIIESLSDPNVPADLLMQYFSDNNTIGLIYGRPDIAEIPKSVEIYADGVNCGGSVEFYPSENEDQTDLYVLTFDLANISTILNAQDAFMRLVTEEGTYFQEMDSDSWLAPYLMWSIISEGINYSTRTSESYLDSSLLGQETSNTPQPTAPIVQTHSFQTDYEAIDRAAQSVFLLEVYDDKNQAIATGSGFVAFDSGTLITNEHVIEDAAYIIAYSDQYKASYKLLNLKAVDKNKDIAILEFDTTAKVSPLTIDVQSRLLRGQPVTAIGSPKGVINTVSSGNISNIVNYSEEIPDCIQFTAPISPGSSGGALFNENGAVIGLCVSSLIEGDAMYYAIPMKYVEEMYLAAQNKEAVTLAQYNDLPSKLEDVFIRSIKVEDKCIEIKWNKVESAENYEIYRRDSYEESFSLIATTQSYSYSDENVVIGSNYEYYIKATHSWCLPSTSETVSLIMVEPTPTPTPKPTKKPTATPVPTATPIPQGKVLYKTGNSDKAIFNIKCRLAELGYYPMSSNFSTKFDAILKSSTRDFQKANNLKVTGVIDENTLMVLNSQTAKQGKLKVPEGIKEYSKREYKKGESGAEILKLKEELRRLGYYKLTSDFDDEYNATMVERVKQFQKNNNLNTSGIIDHLTLLTLYGISPQKGSYYESELKKSSAVFTEMAAGLDLEIPQNAQAEWQIVNNKLKFRIQIENVSSQKTIRSYSLYVYPADKSGNWLIPTNRDYIINGSTVQCGEKKFCDFITLEDANKISSVFVAVYNVKYTDGSSETTPETRLNQAKWIIK